MTEVKQQHVIRTSDRALFKRCRQMWDFTSKIRQDWEPKQTATALSFGTAIHRGLETYYTPDTWKWDREVVQGLALTAFEQSWTAQWNEGFGQDASPEQVTEFEEMKALGLGMLRHYFKWAPNYDTGWTPLAVEHEFEVLVRTPGGDPMRCLCHDWPVVYQGRIDLVIEDGYGEIWIVDFKTTKEMAENLDWLLLDSQVGSYAWAWALNGEAPAGVIYQELRKVVPQAPKTLKRGGLSQDKSQHTTHELYLAEIAKQGLDPADYAEMLEYLSTGQQRYFRRSQIHRSATELANLGRQIHLEASDMVSPSVAIYSNPSKFNCNSCAFKAPCVALLDGSDSDFILRTNYKKRASQEESIETYSVSNGN